MTDTRTQTEMVTFTLNGAAVQVRADHPHLLAALREELDITSPKDGCSPSGQCGCCTVLVDDKAVVACQVPLTRAAGKQITTLEGLPDGERDLYASCFAATGALQCGFCTPGIVMRTKALVDKKGAALERGDAARHLGAHLCRCTGYVKILDAMELIARGEQPPCDTPGGVGSRGMRYEARELALGDRDYIDDMRMPGLLHGALRLADHARAAGRAHRHEPGSERARRRGGVHRRRRSRRAARRHHLHRLARLHPRRRLHLVPRRRARDRGRVPIAQTARRAAALVDVTYDVLRPITDPVAAIDDPENAVWELDGNVLSRSEYRRGGDVDAALAASAHVVHETFQTQRIEHAFLEPEATLATPAARRLAVRVVRWPGRVGRPQPDRVGARRRTRARRGRARLERRRLRRQGGHGQPGADGAGGVAPATAGEVHALTGGEPADAPEAASDPHGVPRGLRRRRSPHRAAVPHGR